MPSLKLCPKNSIFSYLKRETSKSCVHTFNKRGFATVNNSLFAPTSVTKEHAGSVYNSNRSLFRSIKGATCSRVVQFRDGNYGIVVGMLDKQTFSEAAKTYPRQIEGVTIRLSEEGPFISGSQRRPVSSVEVSYDEAYQGLRTFYKDKPDVYGVAKTQVGGKEGFLLFVSDNSDITISSTFQYPVQVSKSGVFKAGSSFRHGHNKDTSRYITSNPQWPTTCTSTMSALIKLPDNIVEKDKLFILGCGHSHIAYNHPFQLHPQVITSLQFAGMDDGMAFDPIGPVLFKKADLEVSTISVSPSVDPPIGFTRLVQVGGVVDVSISEITNLDSLPLKNQVKSIGQFDASQKTYYMLADKEYPVNIVSLEDDIYHIDSGHYYYSLRDVCLLETKTVEEHKRAFIPGHSGAPIVDSQGALVAVYNGANRQFGIATTTEKTTNLIYSIFNSRWKLAQ